MRLACLGLSIERLAHAAFPPSRLMKVHSFHYSFLISFQFLVFDKSNGSGQLRDKNPLLTSVTRVSFPFQFVICIRPTPSFSFPKHLVVPKVLTLAIMKSYIGLVDPEDFATYFLPWQWKSAHSVVITMTIS